jgi:DNA-binding NarL/FixJ family response regulator
MAKKQIVEGLGSRSVVQPDRAGAERRSGAKRPRLLVVGDKAVVDSLQSVFEELPDVVRASSPEETFQLLRSARADIVVLDRNTLDQGDAGADLQASSSDAPVIALALSPEAVGTLGDLLKAVATAGQPDATPQGHCQASAKADDETRQVRQARAPGAID